MEERTGGGNGVGERGGKGEKSARDNDGGGEKRVICSNSTFPPLIFLHNRTVKSMWSSATSCSAASRSVVFSPSIHPSISSLSLLSHFPLSHYFSPLYFLLVLLCVHLLILTYLLLLHFPLSCQSLHTSSLLCSPFITYIAFAFLSTDAFYTHPLLSLSSSSSPLSVIPLNFLPPRCM